MKRAITMTAWRRPHYFARVLEALSRCLTIEDYPLFVSIDGGYPDAQRRMAGLLEHSPLARRTHLVLQPDNLGCAGNTGVALALGFDRGDAEFVVHLEDDTLPGRDFLLFMAWASTTFATDASVHSASGFNRNASLERPDECRQAWLRRHFGCWGWGLWRRVWVEMQHRWFGARCRRLTPDAELSLAEGEEFLRQIVQTPYGSWAWPMEKYWKRNRQQVAPVISRIQNIGVDDGAFCASAGWHRRFQHTPVWIEDFADIAPCDRYTLTDYRARLSRRRLGL